MARRRLLHLALTLTSLGGCLNDRLVDEPCIDDKECWTDQVCARTQAERDAELPGVCRPRGESCVPDEQLGCSCDPSSYSACSQSALPSAFDYPAMVCDPGAMVCVLESEASSSGSDGTESSDTSTTEG